METIDEESTLLNRSFGTQTDHPAQEKIVIKNNDEASYEKGALLCDPPIANHSYADPFIPQVKASPNSNFNIVPTQLVCLENETLLSDAPSQTDPVKQNARDFRGFRTPKFPVKKVVVDHSNRDPKVINSYMTVEFEDVIAESKTQSQTNKSVWFYSIQFYKIFTKVLYRSIGLIFSLPLSILWSLVFSILSYSNTWLCIPLLKVNDITLKWLKQFWLSWIDACMAPFWCHFDRFLNAIRDRPRNEISDYQN